jgi:hypothetical protein
MPAKIASIAAKVIYDIIIWTVAVAIVNTVSRLVSKSWNYLRSKITSRKPKLAPAK